MMSTNQPTNQPRKKERKKETLFLFLSSVSPVVCLFFLFLSFKNDLFLTPWDYSDTLSTPQTHIHTNTHRCISFLAKLIQQPFSSLVWTFIGRDSIFDVGWDGVHVPWELNFESSGKNEKAKSSFCGWVDTESTLTHSLSNSQYFKTTRPLCVDPSPMHVVVVGGWRVVVYMLSSIEHALIPLPEAKARFIALSGRIRSTIKWAVISLRPCSLRFFLCVFVQTSTSSLTLHAQTMMKRGQG